MIIDYNTMKEEVIPNFKGGEGEMVTRMFNDELNKIMVSRLGPGSSIGIHTHDAGSEIIFILEGTGRAVFDGADETVTPGMCHYCPKGHSHGLFNDGDEDLVFFAVVPAQ